MDPTVPKLGVPFAAFKTRRVRPDLIVVHESVTRTRAACEAVLRRKGYGVHYVVDELGQVWVYNDPRTQALAHAGKLNTRSIGVELINPYYPKDATGPRWAGAPRRRARWAHLGAYVLPSPEQVEALFQLLRTLCREHGITEARRTQPTPTSVIPSGVIAHQDSAHDAHADATFPVAYCAHRWAGLTPEQAFSRAVDENTKP